MENFGLSSSRQTNKTPRTSRVYSCRTRGHGGETSQWYCTKVLIYWLLLITLWMYLGFYVQSMWAHDRHENKVEVLEFEDRPSTNSLIVKTGAGVNDALVHIIISKYDDGSSTRQSLISKQNPKKPGGSLQDLQLPMTNSTYGKLLGPFGSLEDSVLEQSSHRRSGNCDQNSDFRSLVWSRSFVLIFHELTMTGAPISMMELASELLSCGATVSAVVLNKKGGLMQELIRRQIKVVEDKREVSFKTAMESDLVIAGSAVCASWIDQYMDYFPDGGNQIAWWIMENRREYFDRAKPVLDKVKLLFFLTESQKSQWLTWSEEEQIKIRSQPVIVPLSVNDELAFVAGISSSLNTPTVSPEKMRKKQQILRESVRRELGLTDEDMLVMSLGSINPGKGQLLLLESIALAVTEREQKNHNLKILLGSVGSKSNKVGYVKDMLNLVSDNEHLSKLVMWTPATTRVASLYSAADVYVTNSQGVGETFGRVTIEAMAYGVAVLGTDSGGTKEIVEHNVTGLLHSMGRSGNKELAENLLFLLRSPETRIRLGSEGRKKVEEMYLKQHMYKRFVDVLVRCMRS